MGKRIGGGILALAGALLLSPSAGANRNFIADWTFSASGVASMRTLGDAECRAENGEIVGVPKTAARGWLIMDKPLQDLQLASDYRCTGGCAAGNLLPAQSSAEG